MTSKIVAHVALFLLVCIVSFGLDDLGKDLLGITTVGDPIFSMRRLGMSLIRMGGFIWFGYFFWGFGLAAFVKKGEHYDSSDSGGARGRLSGSSTTHMAHQD